METTKKKPTADEALALLMAGNARFISGNLEHPNHCEESRKLLAGGQEPIAVVLACADSRVPPVNLFDLGLGDLFICRVAGNIINDHILGSIEYAVEHLHTPLVMVMAHSCCGAVTAVSSGDRIGGHVASLIPSIETAIKQVKAGGCKENLVDQASRQVARNAAKLIAISEPIIADKVISGDVKVVAAFYDFHDGKVTILD